MIVKLPIMVASEEDTELDELADKMGLESLRPETPENIDPKNCNTIMFRFFKIDYFYPLDEYTIIVSGESELPCQWKISKVETELKKSGFIINVKKSKK